MDILAKEIQIPRTGILFGTYTIGKEKLFLEAAKIFNCKIYTPADKKRIIKCLEFPPDVMTLFSDDKRQAKIHLVSMGQLSIKNLEDYLKKHPYFSRIIAFSPTGWSFSGKYSTSTRNKKGNIVKYGVPYSEHSSFVELREFVANVNPTWIIPTVNNRNSQVAREMVLSLKN